MHTKKLEVVVTHSRDCSPASPRITCAVSAHTGSTYFTSSLCSSAIHTLPIVVFILFMFYGVFILFILVLFAQLNMLNLAVNTHVWMDSLNKSDSQSDFWSLCSVT